ncbi:U-scoloptoxin(16)-Er13a-like [Macrobrachium nipponense]|uniref:U-scoloptoxin(16)-Er13a-like n=1 Tax=Macrobrachium nipponense TaxID=159736 RepID=UPI0030C869B5
MGKVLLKTALVLTLLGITFGALQRGVADTHPDHPGKCWDKDSNRAYAEDESWPASDKCAELTCFAQGGDLYYEVHTCGVAVPGTGCHLTPGAGTYPNCCPKIACN